MRMPSVWPDSGSSKNASLFPAYERRFAACPLVELPESSYRKERSAGAVYMPKTASTARMREVFPFEPSRSSVSTIKCSAPKRAPAMARLK